MDSDKDPDEELLLDWRGGATYAVALKVPPQPQPQSTLPFRQKKATSSSGGVGLTKNLATRTLDSTICMKKSVASAAAAAVPVVYELSDSEGSPVPPRHSVVTTAAAKPAVKPAGQACGSPRKQCFDKGAEVVDLVSDSDEEDFFSAATSKKHGNVAYEHGKTSSAKAHNDDHRPTSLTSGSGKQVDSTQGVVRKFSNHDRVLHEEQENWKSSLLQKEFEDLTSEDDGCNSEPEWLRDLEPTIVGGSGDLNLTFDEWRHPSLLTGQVSASGGIQTKTTLNIPGLDCSLETQKTIRMVDLNSDERRLLEEKGKRKLSRATTTESLERTALDDVSGVGNLLQNVKKSCKGRRAPLSEEELAARQAEKQRERDLKKAAQEEDKRAREMKKEELRQQKEAAKAEAAERRRLEKENDKWLKGKNALKNTTVHLDATVVEMVNLGPLILRQLGENNSKYKVVSNPIERTILWNMKRPSAASQTCTEGLGSQLDDVMSSQLTNSQLPLEEVDIKYVVVVFQGEEFSTMVVERRLHAHLSRLQKQYPNYSICYIINGLMSYLYKQDQHQYRTGDPTWRRPKVEQVLAEFISHHTGVHSRLCIDESEIADHIVGLTRSLAQCPFKPKLTSISIKANGDHITKSDRDKDVVKKCPWMKFLVAIPHVYGAIAIAIKREYPTMRSLLNAYLDPSRTDHDKTVLLEDIVKEPTLGSIHTEGRRVGRIASKRIYRVLMAQDGNLTTEAAEEGADHFT